MDEFQAIKQGRIVTHPITSAAEGKLHKQRQESILSSSRAKPREFVLKTATMLWQL